MNDYSPKYDTVVATRTVTNQVDTKHTDYIDWDFPFDDLVFVSCRCLEEEQKKTELARQKDRLRICAENIGNVDYYGNFGGHYEVVGVGMCSRWPFWQPRPYVLVKRIFLGSANVDYVGWLDLPRVEVKDSPHD